MSLVREVPLGSVPTETAVQGSSSDIPVRVPEPIGTVCRAGVSSPRVVSFCMVSVRDHGSPRGPAVPSSGVRSLLTGPTGERRVRDEPPLPHLSERWGIKFDGELYHNLMQTQSSHAVIRMTKNSVSEKDANEAPGELDD